MGRKSGRSFRFGAVSGRLVGERERSRALPCSFVRVAVGVSSCSCGCSGGGGVNGRSILKSRSIGMGSPISAPSSSYRSADVPEGAGIGKLDLDSSATGGEGGMVWLWASRDRVDWAMAAAAEAREGPARLGAASAFPAYSGSVLPLRLCWVDDVLPPFASARRFLLGLASLAAVLLDGVEDESCRPGRVRFPRDAPALLPFAAAVVVATLEAAVGRTARAFVKPTVGAVEMTKRELCWEPSISIDKGAPGFVKYIVMAFFIASARDSVAYGLIC